MQECSGSKTHLVLLLLHCHQTKKSKSKKVGLLYMIFIINYPNFLKKMRAMHSCTKQKQLATSWPSNIDYRSSCNSSRAACGCNGERRSSSWSVSSRSCGYCSWRSLNGSWRGCYCSWRSWRGCYCCWCSCYCCWWSCWSSSRGSCIRTLSFEF